MPFNIGGHIYNGTHADVEDYKNIITRGLVLHLDASALESYPTTGTDWSDISSQINNGILTNGPTFNSSNGGYFTLDGTNDYVGITNNDSLNISTTITLESWIYATSTSATQNVICKSSNTQNTGYIFPRTDNNWTSIYFYLHIGGWQILNTTFPSLNTWHHTAATYDGSTMIIYINGTQVTTKAQTGTITTNTNILAIGQQTGYGEYFGGRVGGVKVYNRSLAATEISHNYNTQKSRFGL